MFNIEEITLMSIYNTQSKETLLSDLREVQPYIDDLEISELTKTIINKLASVTPEDFKKIDFTLSMDYSDAE